MSSEKNGFTKSLGIVTKKVKEMASSSLNHVKSGSEIAIGKIGQYRTQQELKKYKPIFQEDVRAADFSFPRQIRVVDYDKRKESKVCEEAIGFEDCIGNIKILTFYSDEISNFPIQFYPYATAGMYSVCPQNPNLYINLTEYFSYLKNERLNELRNIARSLGAKHFCVVLKENNSSFDKVYQSESKGICLRKSGPEVSCSKKNTMGKSTSNDISIADELTFTESQEPVKPKLRYYKNDSNIRQLIEMRMNKDKRGELKVQKYSLNCCVGSGIDNETADGLRVALNKLNYANADAFAYQTHTENQSVFEYTIEF